MKNTLRKYKYIILCIILSLFTVFSFAYALFLKQDDYNLNYLGSGTVSMQFLGPQTLTEEIFQSAGDIYTAPLSVTNTGSCCFSYSFQLELTVPNDNSGLENAVLVYLDDVLYGTMYSLAQNGIVTVEASQTQYSFPISVEKPLYMNESKTHTLKLEYHIGAGAYFNDKYFDLNVSCKAVQLVQTDTCYLYVNNSQFVKLLNTVNYTNKTIKLLENITLNADLTIGSASNIDLNGHTLNLNGHTLTFAFNDVGTYQIRDTAGGGSITGGNITVNTPNAVVLNKGTTWSNIVFSVTNSAFAQIYIDYLEENHSKIVETFDITGDFDEYATFYSLTIQSSDDTVLSVLGATASVIPTDINREITLTFGFLTGENAFNRSLDVTVLGITDGIIDRIETENGLSFTDGTLLARHNIQQDIFLPVKDRYYGANIKWISSNPEILSADGKFGDAYADTDIALSAIYSFNGQNVLRTYYLTVIGKTNQEKINEVSNIFGSINFVSIGATEELPKVSDFAYMGFESFDFSFSAGDANLFDFVTENGIKKQLTLVRETEPLTLLMTLTGTIGEQEYQSTIDVNINLVRSSSIFEVVNNYVLTHFEEFGGNTFLSFDVPSYYQNSFTTVEYSIKNGFNTVNANLSYTNPIDASSYVSVINGTPPNGSTPGVDARIVIDEDNVPTADTLIHVEEKITYNNGVEIQTETRLVDFYITGLLHYGEDIEDKTLFHLLRKVCDTNSDWYITYSEALSLTEIPSVRIGSESVVSFTNSNIESLKGLEHFVNLTKLNLNSNYISDLSPLAGLFSLNELNLQNNNIIDISPLQNLISLKKLILSNNDIRDISAVKNLDILEELDLNNNLLLSDVEPLKMLSRLKYLNMLSTNGALNNLQLKINLNYLISAYSAARDYYGGTGSLRYYTTSASNYWTPTADNNAANEILDAIVPIYEFSDVIYLPYNVYYGNTAYSVQWSTDFSDIITVSNDRAYVTQPSSDIDVKIYATIVYNGTQYYKAFTVLSRQTDAYLGSLLIETSGGGTVDAYTAIPDNTLRYHLFSFYDTDSNYTISRTEIMSKAGDMLDLMGLEIDDISGLEYFDGVQTINLQNNSFEDISPLASISSLKTLYLNNGDFDFSNLTGLRNLIKLCVYGSKNLNDNTTLRNLYDIYCNNAGIIINKDSLLDADKWNPYTESIANAISRIKNIYVLSYGETVALDTAFTLTMYDGTVINSADIGSTINYTIPDGQSFIFDTSTVADDIKMSVLPAFDKYEVINATITYNTVSVTARLTVVILAKTDIKIEWHDGTEKDLFSVVDDKKLIETILTLYNGSTITRTQLESLTEIRIDFTKGGKGLDNLLVFKGLNTLTKLNLQFFSSENTGVGMWNLSFLNSTDYPALVNLSFKYSNVDIYDLVNIKSQIESLTLNCCHYIKMYGGVGYAFSGFDALTSLTITNSGVSNFEAIEQLQNLTVLNIYGNPASTKYATDESVAVVYSNLMTNSPTSTYTYYVKNEELLWVPEDLSYILNTITDLYVKIDDGTTVENAKYGFYDPNYNLTSGYTVKLPEKYNIRGIDYTIAWTTSASSAIPINSTVVGGYKNCSVTQSAVKAYVKIKGVVNLSTAYKKTIEYIFVINGNGIDNGTYLNFDTFMTNGVFEDPVFAYRAVGLLSSNAYGLFTMTNVRSKTSMSFANSNNANDKYTISSIKGIKNFTGLTSVNLGYNSISYISDLYYLNNLQDFRINENQLKSLRVEDETDPNYGRSVFYNMSGLYRLYLHRNYNITDFRPMSERSDPTYLQTLRIIYMSNLNNDFVYNEDYHKNEALYAWWEQRKTVTGGESELRYMRETISLKENATTKNISKYLDILKAFDNPENISLEQVADLHEVTQIGQVLQPSISVRHEGDPTDTTYSLEWYPLGQDGIMSISGTTITAIRSDIQRTNHKVPTRVYVTFSGDRAGKLVNLDLKLMPGQGTLYIELSQLEYEDVNRYPAASKKIENGQYYVEAETAIPDGAVLNRIYEVFNTTQDSIITLEEREKSVSYFDTSNRGQTDITGLELFWNIEEWRVNNGKIKAIPDLPHRSDSALRSINITYNSTLDYIGGLTYLHNNDSVNYTRLSDILTTLDISNCYDIGDEDVNVQLANMNLETLKINDSNLSDYSFLNDLQDTLITFSNTGNNYVYTNGIPEQLRKFYLKRAAYSPAPSGVSATIISDYIKINADYCDEYTSTPTPLPDSITIYGEQYGLTWDSISSTDYTLTNESGIYSITINPTAGESVTLYARAVYNDGSTNKNTHREIITLRTDLTVAVNAEYITEATFEAGYNNGGSLSEYIPDAVLRNMIIKKADTDSNGILTQAEMLAVTSLNVNTNVGDENDSNYDRLNVLKQSVADFTGIELLANLQTLNVYLANTSDYSPLGQLQHLVNLIIWYNLLPLNDFGFMLGLSSLNTLNLNKTVYSNMSFVMDMTELTRISNVDASNTQDAARFVRNAWAYGRTVNSLEENATQMGSGVSTHTSKANQKSGMLILNKIVTDFMTTVGDTLIKGSLELSNEGVYTLPTEVEYKGVTYVVQWQSLSDMLSLSSNILTVSSNAYKSVGGLVAKINFGDISCYRHFEVTVN